MTHRPLPLLLLLLAALGAALPGKPPPPQAEFDEANRLYAAGRYEPALALYERVAATTRDWKVYFNAGNCLFKLGRHLDAKIHYLRARRLAPGEGVIDGNLALVNRRFRDSIPAARPDFPARLAAWLAAALPPNAVNLLLLALVWLACLCLLLLLRKRPFQRRWLYGLAAALLLLAVLAGWQVLRLKTLGHPGQAVVCAEKAELRSGPGADQTIFFQVHAGLEVQVLERHDGWLYVSASPQVAGWIERASLQLL